MNYCHTHSLGPRHSFALPSSTHNTSLTSHSIQSQCVSSLSPTPPLLFSLPIYRGADLAALVREASINALKEMMSLSLSSLSSGGGSKCLLTCNTEATEAVPVGLVMVQQRHFEDAFKRVTPSVQTR